MKHYVQNSVDVIEVPIKDFKIRMVDKRKRSAYPKNYVNAGYFATHHEEGIQFTLPTGHLVCDYEANSSKWCTHYCNERGTRKGTKFIFDSSKALWDRQFMGKSLSCMIIANGVAHAEERTEVSSVNCDYLISGIPVLRDGQDVSWSKFVKKQGWTGGELYGTSHVLIGIKGAPAKTIYILCWKSTSGNMVSSGEAYRKFKAMGFTDVIKLDGGGSFMMNVNGKLKYTAENRQINTIITFDPTGINEPITESTVEVTKPTTGTTYPVPTRVLRKGNAGDDVKWMQAQLNKAGFKLKVTGAFDAATVHALKCFQAAKKISITGTCAAPTVNALKAGVKVKNPYVAPTKGSFTKGTSGTSVRWLQFQLNIWGGVSVDLDGYFGSTTLTAVKAFQTAHKITSNGWCGPLTRAALVKY